MKYFLISIIFIINLPCFFCKDDEWFINILEKIIITYDTNYFHDAGNDLFLLNTGYILKIDDTGRLLFIIEDSHTVMDTFALRAYGTVRPGDDILLLFELVGYNLSVFEARAGDFVAVYDKIMHERAKEFCNNFAIADWTNFDTDEVVSNAVAYSHGCADAVEHFNADLLASNQQLQHITVIITLYGHRKIRILMKIGHPGILRMHHPMH